MWPVLYPRIFGTLSRIFYYGLKSTHLCGLLQNSGFRVEKLLENHLTSDSAINSLICQIISRAEFLKLSDLRDVIDNVMCHISTKLLTVHCRTLVKHITLSGNSLLFTIGCRSMATYWIYVVFAQCYVTIDRHTIVQAFSQSFAIILKLINTPLTLQNPCPNYKHNNIHILLSYYQLTHTFDCITAVYSQWYQQVFCV